MQTKSQTEIISTNQQPTIWALLDDRAGNNGQTIGVAQAFNTPFIEKQISYTKLAKLPNALKGASLIGVTTEAKALIKPPYPDIVIASGRKLACIARYIKKRSPKTKLIQIMYAGFLGIKDFELIAVPKHDKLFINSNNIFRITTSPHKLTHTKLEQEKNKWQTKINSYNAPFTAVFIGGSTKKSSFTEEMALELALLLRKISKENSSTILITTSRRTGAKQEEILRQTLPKDKTFFYSWQDKSDNPYFAFMANANNIIVTGDSISMVSESLALGTNVYIYSPDNFLTGKHQKFIEKIYQQNLALPFTKEQTIKFSPQPSLSSPVKNSATDIVQALKKRLAKR